MRLPVKSETDAFRIAYGSTLLIGVSVALGAFVSPLVGIALFAGGVLGAIGYDVAVKDPIGCSRYGKPPAPRAPVRLTAAPGSS